MPFMLLIMEPRGQRTSRTLQEGQEVYGRMLGFSKDLEHRGLLKASNSLKSDRQAVRVQVREGQSSIVDGPFAEAKEMVGGFFYLDCQTKEEAVAIAQTCPAAEWATVEVREVGPCFEDER